MWRNQGFASGTAPNQELFGSAWPMIKLLSETAQRVRHRVAVPVKRLVLRSVIKQMLMEFDRHRFLLCDLRLDGGNGLTRAEFDRLRRSLSDELRDLSERSPRNSAKVTDDKQ